MKDRRRILSFMYTFPITLQYFECDFRSCIWPSNCLKRSKALIFPKKFRENQSFVYHFSFLPIYFEPTSKTFPNEQQCHIRGNIPNSNWYKIPTSSIPEGNLVLPLTVSIELIKVKSCLVAQHWRVVPNRIGCQHTPIHLNTYTQR